MRLSLLILALALFSPSLARADAIDFTVDAHDSSLTYHMVHKLHKVDGVSRALNGRARLLPDGKAQIMVRVPVATFDSGNVNRDAHMKEIVEAARFPDVELKAVGNDFAPPAKFPATLQKTISAQLTLHGVQHTFELPVTVTWESDHRVRVKATLAVSLDEYKIERPSLMFVKVEDRVLIDADVVLSK